MLELEAKGTDLVIGSLNPPENDFRHERHAQLQADVIYPPPRQVMKARFEKALHEERFAEMIADHEKRYGKSFKAAIRARNAVYFADEFARRGVDHVHIHFANRATHTALFMKQYRGTPFSFTAHAQDFMVDLGSDELLREMCAEAEFVVAVSDWSRDLLAKTCPDSEDKIVRIYNGIRLDDFPQAQPASEGRLKLISIGRLIEFKGFQHLLNACSMLKEWGDNFELTIIGTGPLQDQLLQQREALGLQDQVTFAGVRTQEQVKAALAESHAFVLPCITDSKGASDILPTVIMEAMACSLPVVSTTLVGVPEMVEHETTGLLTTPGDETELALALQKLAHDPALRQSLGEAGRRLAESRFQRHNTAGALLAQIEDTQAGKNRRKPSRPKILYLVDTWRSLGKGILADELRCVLQSEHEIQPYACGLMPKSSLSEEDQVHLKKVEFLPNAFVLEGEWKLQRELVERVFELYKELGAEIDDERFFLEARRAVHLAALVRKRGIPQIHGARSDTALTAWLVSKLCEDVRFSFAAGPNGIHHPKVLDVLEKDAAVFSRADSPEKDHLKLGRPKPRLIKMGSAILRLGRPKWGNRTPINEEWIERLLA